MKRSVFMIIAVALVGVLAVSGTALAAKGGTPGPPTTTTTTTTQPTVWTCQARWDNGGTAWHLGEYYTDGGVGHYRVPVAGDDAFPACIDLRSEHAGTREWKIEWGGTIKNGNPMNGLRLVFEAEVHSGTYLDIVVTEGDNPLTVSVPADPNQDFVFVAMPWSGDKWTSSWIILTPTPDP